MTPQAEITTLRALAREYFSLPNPILSPLELAARLMSKDRPEEVTTRCSIEKCEAMCESEKDRPHLQVVI